MAAAACCSWLPPSESLEDTPGHVAAQAATGLKARRDNRVSSREQ